MNGIDPRQLLDLVVRPTLLHLDLLSPAAEQLVLGTAAQESKLCYLKQLGLGPAVGLWQMEPATERDLWENFLAYKPELRAKVEALLAPEPSRTQQLATNLAYGCAMCRVHYLRKPAALPDAADIQGMARYWKLHYNTPLGRGTINEFVRSWELVAGCWRKP